MPSLVKTFVEGNVQNHFLELESARERFIAEMSPDFERVHASLGILEKKPFGTITKQEMLFGIRTDLEAAKKTLTTYSRLGGFIDHRLAMMSSNFQLPDFLRSNDFPPGMIGEFQDELRAYWNVTYGPLVEYWREFKAGLEELRGLLEPQVVQLEALPTTPYGDGFAEAAKLRAMFAKEREVFYGKIVARVSTDRGAVSRLKSIVKSHSTKTKEIIRAHIRIVKKGVEQEMTASTSKVRKALVVLAYLLGALFLIVTLKSRVIKGIYSMVMNKLTTATRDPIKIQVASIDAAIADVATQAGTNALEALLPVLP